MSFQSKEFKKLQSEWYGKLKESGFEDIEDLSTDKQNLKRWTSFKCKKGEEAKFEIAQFYDSENVDKIYYSEGIRFSALFTFRNDTDRSIWLLHLRGLSTRKIAQQIQEYKCVWVHYIITRIKKEFLHHLKKQLNENNPNRGQLYLFEDQGPAYLLQIEEELR